MRAESTLYIKEKWERELGEQITDDEWWNICKTQCTSTNSRSWREFNWKNTVKYFITPKIRRRFASAQQPCWRECGQVNVDHAHIFWGCEKLQNFWQTIWSLIKKIIGYGIPKSSKTLYLGLLGVDIIQKEDEYLTKILLTASRKNITRLWYKPEPPTEKQWMCTVNEIFVMAKMTYRLRLQETSFNKKWEKLTDFFGHCGGCN